MSRLTIQLLGAPTIAVDGQPIETDTRKATALMAYLAMQPGVHTRDHLATLLWPELDQTRARAALRRTLSALNHTPAAAWLDITRESVALRQDATVDLDVHRFRTPAAPDGSLDQLEDAAAHYTGDFLAGFSLRDSTLFDDWQFFAAEELRLILVDVLDRLAAGLARAGRFDDAIGHMRRRLQLDPLHEAAHRTLMRLYVWNDQRNAALRQYRECVRILADELGVPPLDETTALYDEIQRNPTLPPPAGAPSADTLPAGDHAPTASGAPAALPLVGRDDEVAALTAALRRPGSVLVLVAGEAGIGKTRLLETCLAVLPAPQPVILATQCFDGEAELAYTPIVDLLRQGLARPDGAARLAAFPAQWRHEVSRLAPELADPATASAPATLDNAAAKSRFFEAVTQLFLHLLGDEHGGIVAVDNVQWADQASRELLAFLARRLAGEQIALILTWRNDHAELDAHLRQLVHAVRAKVDVLELTLTRLDASAVAVLVANALGHAEPELAARLFAESEGNPFFVTEYLALVQRAPDLGTAAPWEMPGGVRDLLHSRLRAVDETGQQLLTAAAAIGRTFAFDLLRDVSGRSEEESIAALEQLLDQRLIREGEGLVYDFFHDQLRALVYAEISAVRRRLLHRRVADALLVHARRMGQDEGAQAALIAHHRAAAGQVAEARAAYLRAAENARRVYANVEAIHHLQRALTLGAPETAAIQLQLGELYTLVGDYGAARAAYETAAAHAPDARLPRIEFRLGDLHHRLGNWELAAGHFAAALERPPDDAADDAGDAGQAWRSHVLAAWSLAVEQQGDHDRAYALAGAALDAASLSEQAPALAQAHNILSIIARHRGRLDAALAHARQSVALADSLDDPHARVAAYNSLALALADAGDSDAAIAQLERAIALCAAQGDRHREAALHDHLADLYHAAGREEDAMAELKQAVAIFAQIGAEDARPNPEIWKLVEW